jgi:DNA polymerase-4
VAERDILHIDMNAFYCSCHAAESPGRYRGKPTAVAGSPETRHGVVVTASYEARRMGVRATMTVPEALRVCPSLILIEPDFTLYRRYSREVFRRVREYTPLVEVFSIDECFADVGGSRQFGSVTDIAHQIQKRLLRELGLPCSIGIGSNKFLAKMASDLKKPLGISELRLEHVEERLWPLPIGQMFGVGMRTAERLQKVGIRTIGHLARSNPNLLWRLLGKRGLELWRLANGHDDSPVSPERAPAKSIGHSITLPRDVAEFEEIRTVLLNLADQVGRRLRRHKACGRTVQITIRYADRHTITRAKTLPTPTDLTEDIYLAALALAREHVQPGRKVRLLGVSVHHLVDGHEGDEPSRQLRLFPEEDALELPGALPTPHRDRWRRLDTVTDQLRDKYGEDIIIRGRMLSPHDSNQIRDRRRRGTSLQKDTLE